VPGAAPEDRTPDLLVIGGGAGGLAAARAAVRHGARVVLVDAGPLGGDCTFTGCVPSKTLIEAARRGTSFHDATAAVRNAVATIAATETDAVLVAEGVEVVHGHARFVAARVVDIDGVEWEPRRVVIATGARPAVPPIPGLDAVAVLTNETIFDLTGQPRRLGILGGGAIGCELAQPFQRFGTAVTVIEAADRLLPGEEPEASEVIATVFGREGIDVRVGTRLRGATTGNGAIRLDCDGTAPVEVDALLVATGRAASIEGLGLDRAGIDVDEHGVVVDDTLATTAKDVWAAGDVIGRVQLTHAADEMGRIAAGNALGRRRRRYDAGLIASVVFTEPEVASIGPTVAELKGRHRVARLPMTAVDRAVAARATDGFVQLVAGPRPILRNLGGGRLLAATIVAERAGELISEAALAVQTGMFVGRLAQTVHPYPTWSTALRQAAAQFFMEIDGRRAR
jgi:pyruvate/2-oxoglutarate dehydrogenase complex dihydrolipoamide dehydrogenase (E3) component